MTILSEHQTPYILYPTLINIISYAINSNSNQCSPLHQILAKTPRHRANNPNLVYFPQLKNFNIFRTKFYFH